MTKARSVLSIWKDIYTLLGNEGYRYCTYGAYPIRRWAYFRYGQKPEVARKLFSYDKKPYSCALTTAPTEMGETYFKEYLSQDVMARYIVEHEPHSEGGCIIDSYDFRSNPEYHSVDLFFRKWGACSRVMIPLPSLSENWYLVLTASADRSHEESHQLLQARGSRLLESIKAYNFEMLFYHGDKFNPFRSHEVFGEQAVSVLKAISAGMTVTDAAQQVGLSPDGVKYHLKLMRQALQANNVTQLVALCKDMGII